MSQFRSLFLLLALCFCQALLSQKVYREGYIVKSNGDRFEGLVAFSPDKKIPEYCIFKRFDIAVPVTYSSADLSSFGYRNGKRFESVEWEGKKRFFETLVYGDLTLLYSGSGYFLKKNDQPMIDLDSRELVWTDQNGQKTFANKRELMVYLASGTQILKEKMPDPDKDLVATVSAYNKKEGKSYTVFDRSFTEKQLANTAWQSGAARSSFGVIAGFNCYSLNLKTDRDLYYPSPESVIGLAYGITYNRVLSRKNDRLSFRGDLIYLRHSFYAYNEGLTWYKTISTDDAFFSFSAIRLPLMLQYSFNERKLKPFVNAGLSASYILNSNYNHIKESESWDKTRIYTTQDSEFSFRKTELSLTAGAGVKMRISGNLYFHIEARVEAGSGIFDRDYPEPKGFKQYSIQPEIFTGITF